MMGELLLTIDTSTGAGSVAVSRGESLLGEILLQTRTTHSDRLLQSVHQLLADLGLKIGDFDAFGIVRGPGAFTGLRVGMATVKGLALAADRPVAAVSSLQTLALQAPCIHKPVCALIDARKHEVYAGLYRWENGLPVLQGEERVAGAARLLPELPDEVIFVGNGALLCRDLIVREYGDRAHFLPWSSQTPRAGHAACLALAELRAGRSMPLARLAPIYIRPSEAEIAFGQKKGATFIEG